MESNLHLRNRAAKIGLRNVMRFSFCLRTTQELANKPTIVVTTV